MSSLYAGFFVGEFGWELMRWQGIVRHYAQNFGKVVIGCEAGHEYLYDDFASDFVIYDRKPSTRNMWMCDKGVVPQMIVPEGAHYIMPSRMCLNDNYHQSWRRYGTGVLSNTIVIHARATSNYRTEYRNWPVWKWELLVAWIKIKSWNKVYSIGTDAHYINGTVDYRNKPLEDVCNLLSGSRMCIGPSSGPMHLAALCGCSVVVWTHDRMEAIGHTNRERYEHAWNPFGVHTRVIDDQAWNPSVERVTECLPQLL